jgi:hypothetical protein
MAELQLDPFVSTEPEAEVGHETLHLLDERGADEQPLIPAAEAREQISQWLSKFSTGQQR